MCGVAGIVLLYGALLILPGCGNENQKWHLSFDAHDQFAAPVRVLHNGAVIAEFPGQRAGTPPVSKVLSGQLVVHETEESTKQPGALHEYYLINKDFRFELLTTGGWKEFYTSEERLDRSQWTRTHDEMQISLPFGEDFVWFDNRGGQQVTVQLGDLPITINADEASVVRFNFDDRPEDQRTVDRYFLDDERWKVRIGDLDVGEMLPGHKYLLDLTGKRSYSLNSIVYSLTPFAESEPSSRQLAADYIHELPSALWEIDYFLRPAPPEISTEGYSDERKWELVESTGETDNYK